MQKRRRSSAEPRRERLALCGSASTLRQPQPPGAPVGIKVDQDFHQSLRRTAAIGPVGVEAVGVGQGENGRLSGVPASAIVTCRE
jgi:hypothetical protein